MAAGDRLEIHHDDAGLGIGGMQQLSQLQGFPAAAGMRDADGPMPQQLGIGDKVLRQ